MVSSRALKSRSHSEWQYGCQMNIKPVCDAAIHSSCQNWLLASDPSVQEVLSHLHNLYVYKNKQGQAETERHVCVNKKVVQWINDEALDITESFFKKKKRFVALIQWRTNYACHFYYYSLLNNNRPAYRLCWWGHSKNHSQEQIGKSCEEVWENHVETAGWPVTPASERADWEGRHPRPLYLLPGGADTSRSEPTK